MERMFAGSSGIRRRATHICINKNPCNLWLINRRLHGSITDLLLVSSRGGDAGAGLFGNPISRVVLHKLLHVAVSPACVEVVLLHLRINLIVVPVVMVEAVNSAHHARAVTSAGAVHIK